MRKIERMSGEQLALLDRVLLQLEADEDVRVARWAAEKQRDVFERAFGRELGVD